MSLKVKKSIFEYTDYRIFLRDIYEFKKKTDPKFSFRFFSRMAGFKSSNFLNLVMKGHRNIGSKSIEKFSKGLKLRRDEAKFFHTLVLFNQATTNEEKQKFAEMIVTLKGYQRVFPLAEAQFNYFNHWYFIPIREMISLPAFKEDPEWIAKEIIPPISPKEATLALSELQKLGLAKRGPSGRLIQVEADVESPAGITSAAIVKVHKELIKLGSESIERIERDKREIMSITFSLPLALMGKIKEMTREFRNELLEACGDADHDSVFQLNIQLFPLAEPSSSKKDLK